MATRIYVGNLPYSATNAGRQGRGVAAARNAIAGLNGAMLGGRALRVNEAQPRTDRSGGYDDRSRGPRW